MADTEDQQSGNSSPEITFKVKAAADKTVTITISPELTVQDLKTKLSHEEYANIPADRQRLIYSGRVLKNEETLNTYKIKPNTTVHLVKSAASNPSPSSSRNTPVAAAIPPMSSGTANNPLAGLTGARYAGHVNLPSLSSFGADGGMSLPSEGEMSRMMSDPTFIQNMRSALENPQFIDMMIQMNPTLRNMPNARAILSSPMVRDMLTNPEMRQMVARMRGSMGPPRTSGSSVPGPGVTDYTPTTTNPSSASTTSTSSNTRSEAQSTTPDANPFSLSGLMNNVQVSDDGGLPPHLSSLLSAMAETNQQNQSQPGQGQAPDPSNPFLSLLNPSMFQPPPATPSANNGGSNNPSGNLGSTPAQSQQINNLLQSLGMNHWLADNQNEAQRQTQRQEPPVPDLQTLFGVGPGAQEANNRQTAANFDMLQNLLGSAGELGVPRQPGEGTGAGSGGAVDEGLMRLLQSFQRSGNTSAMADLLGAGLGNNNSNTPADTRPPEERYAEQLLALNDMGFLDFDRNIAALRRTGGNVHAAVEHLLNEP